MAIDPRVRSRDARPPGGDGAPEAGQPGRVVHGDAAAFNRLVTDHWIAISSYASQLLDQEPGAGDDVAQDVFLLVWSGELDWPSHVPPRPFLLGVARNLCLNRRRRLSVRARLARRLRAHLARLQHIPTPAEEFARDELSRKLDAALLAMPRSRREVFLLVRVQGLSYAEVARVMEIAPQTVANRMSAALKDLRAIR